MKKIIIIFLAITSLFVFGISQLYQKQAERLFEKEGSQLCLNKSLSKSELRTVLLANGYVKDEKDAALISDWLLEKIYEKDLPNLGALNTRDFQIPANRVLENGGQGLQERLNWSYRKLGVIAEEHTTCSHDHKTGEKNATIKVTIKPEKKSNTTVDNVLVKLTRHYEVTDENGHPQDCALLIDSAKTDEKGIVSFRVDKDGYYSVIPVRKSFEYGVPKGTLNGEKIESEKEFNFIQREHRIKMFDSSTYARIKADKVFRVRELGDYITELYTIVGAFILSWLLVCVVIYVRNKKLIEKDPTLYQYADYNIIWILMILNAICLTMMLAITNPLIDLDHAYNMMGGTVVGCIALASLSWIDYVKFYSDEYKVKFNFFAKYLKSKVSDKIPEGIGFITIAVVLVFALAFFGYGPQDSTAKVNLDLHLPLLHCFQPSEISKFLIVAAIALFFTNNARLIQDYASNHHLKEQFTTLTGITIALLFLLSLYVLAISDMGPALVLAVTFIILYSIVRHDTDKLIIGVISYLGILWGANLVTEIDCSSDMLNTLKSTTVWLFSLVWFVVWFWGGYKFFWKKKIYESAGILNMLILLFLHGGEILAAIPFTHNQGNRLLNRIAASGSGVWDNEALGGDQVAQGIWGLASGGFDGQGIGLGNANLIPAFHTDMIFESIGEVMGFGTLAFILLCYALLVILCLNRAKETGHSFLFYIISGIGIVTGVQVFVILLGSLGIVPLTGVSLPFLSYGNAGLIINLAVFGIIIGMSRHLPTEHAKKDIIGYDRVIKHGIWVFSALFIVVLGYSFNYQVMNRDYYLTKTATITNTSGEHLPVHNPRIDILLRNLNSGNIYDCNNVLLATSDPDILMKHKKVLLDAGIDESVIDSLSHTRKRRYYPFEDDLFFMLGDMNTRNLSSGVLSKDPYGYLAEERHIDALRGFDIVPSDSVEITRSTVISPFLPKRIKKEMYAPPAYERCPQIIAMLKDGINGNLVKDWNAKRQGRDLHLTIDAALQTKLQDKMAEFAKTRIADREEELKTAKTKQQKANALKAFDNTSRVSLILLDANCGDLLCSANYPTPKQDIIVEMFNNRKYTYVIDTCAYTERDLALTFQTHPGSTAKIFSAAAGLNELGEGATKKISIAIKERIHEGTYPEPHGMVSMEQAIVESSNCFFIKLGNQEKLYPQLNRLYKKTGVRVDYDIPYIFNLSEFNIIDEKAYDNKMSEIAQASYKKYEDYIASGKKRKLNFHECQMLWGQGLMDASPLNMARLVSAVANGGKMPSTRYTKNCESHHETLINEHVETLKNYMKAETRGHRLLTNHNATWGMGGKTGTPERNGRNDGWYICFFSTPSINKNDKNTPKKAEKTYALALRIERCSGSGEAQRWMNVIMESLEESGYLKRQ